MFFIPLGSCTSSTFAVYGSVGPSRPNQHSARLTQDECALGLPYHSEHERTSSVNYPTWLHILATDSAIKRP